LSGEMQGRKIVGVGREIKAATFHNLEIVSTHNGYETVIVFDI